MGFKNVFLSVWILLSFTSLNAHAEPLAPATLGSDFLEATWFMTAPERERAIYSAVLDGHVPSATKTLQKIPLTMKDASGKTIKAYIKVSSNFIAIGSDSDNVLMPMSFRTAAALSQRLGFVLPTRAIVKAIAKKAAMLQGRPLPPSHEMVTNHYYLMHQKKLQKDLQKAGSESLVGGHKKNLILTNKLIGKPSFLAIYGWKDHKGGWIQRINTDHAADYVDYSHGVRMVSQTIYVEGKAMSIFEVASHPVLHKLVSDEGPIDLKKILKEATATGHLL